MAPNVPRMDALPRSIAEEKRVSAPTKKGQKRIEEQKEMLLPIPVQEGKGSDGGQACYFDPAVCKRRRAEAAN